MRGGEEERRRGGEEERRRGGVSLLLALWLKQSLDLATMTTLVAGDRFTIVGPTRRNGRPGWWPGKEGGWQPRLWSGLPGQRGSISFLPGIWLDLGGVLHAEEVRATGSFVSARVMLNPGGPYPYAWINVARHGRSWAKLYPPAEGQNTSRRTTGAGTSAGGAGAGATP